MPVVVYQILGDGIPDKQIISSLLFSLALNWAKDLRSGSKMEIPLSIKPREPKAQKATKKLTLRRQWFHCLQGGFRPKLWLSP